MSDRHDNTPQYCHPVPCKMRSNLPHPSKHQSQLAHNSAIDGRRLLRPPGTLFPNLFPRKRQESF